MAGADVAEITRLVLKNFH